MAVSLVFQARRAGISLAGGVNHRMEWIICQKARRADTSVVVVLCRPFRPKINGYPESGASRHRLRLYQPSGLIYV